MEQAQIPASHTPRQRRTRGGPVLDKLELAIEVVTPMLGGGAAPRTLDDVDVIRAATVRGHLRFWWRALHAHRCASAAELHGSESALWGQAADDGPGRSAVGASVTVECAGPVDEGAMPTGDRAAYALWTTRQPPAPRRCPGTRFRLALLVPRAHAEEVQAALRAWILFGGYGSRTRRGLGTLTVRPSADWLPRRADREGLQTVFARHVFAAGAGPGLPTPVLAGAALHVGATCRSALEAWYTALEWLMEFRQGTIGEPGDRAREPAPQAQAKPQRPSISNWPEADKIRHLIGKTAAHTPRHNATPAWPRAGFGLPLPFRFQPKGRNGAPIDEPPGNYRLLWREGSAGPKHDRLASPLIVKALPLADGRFAPCALWLHRAYPLYGQVLLEGCSQSAAPFDRLLADGDAPQFSALAGKPTLRDAFLDWLHDRCGTEVIAP